MWACVKDNIFERKVECGDEVGETAPLEAKGGALEPLLASRPAKGGTLEAPRAAEKSGGLKRSITLARNPFTSLNRKDVKKHIKEMAAAAKKTDEEAKPGSEGSGGASAAPINRTESVKNFFSKVVHHISTSTSRGFKGGGSEAGGGGSHAAARTEEWKSYFDANDRVPGVIGIRNHGNTCFINSILQCLSFTDILAEYFVLDQVREIIIMVDKTKQSYNVVH